MAKEVQGERKALEKIHARNAAKTAKRKASKAAKASETAKSKDVVKKKNK